MIQNIVVVFNIAILLFFSEKVFDFTGTVVTGGMSFMDKFDKPAVAIVAPYRNRPHQLWNFLDFFSNFLKSKQGTQFWIYIVNQTDSLPGMLLNVGFAEAMM